MHRRGWGLAALLCLGGSAALAAPPPAQLAPAQAPAQAPQWAASITDIYLGREWNAGEMDCARTEFSLRGGALVGHYWIGDADPFEGELSDFVPQGGHSGLFTWTDRYGQGAIYVRFSADGQSFDSIWGEAIPDPNRPGYGLRGATVAVPGCGGATS